MRPSPPPGIAARGIATGGGDDCAPGSATRGANSERGIALRRSCGAGPGIFGCVDGSGMRPEGASRPGVLADGVFGVPSVCPGGDTIGRCDGTSRRRTATGGGPPLASVTCGVATCGVATGGGPAFAPGVATGGGRPGDPFCRGCGATAPVIGAGAALCGAVLSALPSSRSRRCAHRAASAGGGVCDRSHWPLPVNRCHWPSRWRYTCQSGLLPGVR